MPRSSILNAQFLFIITSTIKHTFSAVRHELQNSRPPTRILSQDWAKPTASWLPWAWPRDKPKPRLLFSSITPTSLCYPMGNNAIITAALPGNPSRWSIITDALPANPSRWSIITPLHKGNPYRWYILVRMWENTTHLARSILTFLQ